MTTKTKQNHSEQQAKAQLESIVELVDALKRANEIDGMIERRSPVDDAQCAIQSDALSVEVRGGWYVPGQETDRENAAPVEFCILLCTGGPAVRLIGDLDAQNQPEAVRLEHQDWGTPWTEYSVSETEMEAMLTYCQQFYFGE